jgi:hypothetical protein
MAIDFASLLTDEQKRGILEQRQAQFAAEAWQHSLNRDVNLAAGNVEAVALADEALVTLESALAATADELLKLAPVVTPVV